MPARKTMPEDLALLISADDGSAMDFYEFSFSSYKLTKLKCYSLLAWVLFGCFCTSHGCYWIWFIAKGADRHSNRSNLSNFHGNSVEHVTSAIQSEKADRSGARSIRSVFSMVVAFAAHLSTQKQVIQQISNSVFQQCAVPQLFLVFISSIEKGSTP